MDKVIQKKVADLIPNPVNVRKHTPKQIAEFKRSIQKFGVIRPIVIDENNMVLAGHGLLQALQELQVEEASVIVMKNLSENDKKKLLLADNKIATLGVDNYQAIEDILSELGANGDFDVVGYDSETLEELYGVSSVEAEVAESGTPVSRALEDISQKPQEQPQEFKPAPAPTPSKAIQEARQEAEESRQFVICPSCGECIWL